MGRSENRAARDRNPSHGYRPVCHSSSRMTNTDDKQTSGFVCPLEVSGLRGTLTWSFREFTVYCHAAASDPLYIAPSERRRKRVQCPECGSWEHPASECTMLG